MPTVRRYLASDNEHLPPTPTDGLRSTGVSARRTRKLTPLEPFTLLGFNVRKTSEDARAPESYPRQIGTGELE